MLYSKILMLLVPLLNFAIGLQTMTCQAGEGNLKRLYQRFLTNPHAENLIFFEREILIPKREAGEREVRLPNGTVAVLHTWTKDHIAFATDGLRWLIAISRRDSLNNELNLTAAEEIMGYDGYEYWRLRLDNSISIHLGSADSKGKLPPFMTLNTLTIIPDAEARREQGLYRSDIQLASLLALWRECQGVVQFGYTNNLTGVPRLDGPRLQLPISRGKTLMAKLTGTTHRPDEISYTDHGFLVTAKVNYDEDTLTIRREFMSNILFEARYCIRGISAPVSPRSPEIYSWRRYKESAGSVLAVAITNGQTVQLDLKADNTVVPGRIIAAASPIEKRGQLLRLVVYVLFVLLAIPWVRLGYRHAKNILKPQSHDTTP